MGDTIQGVEVSWDRVRELFSLDPAVAHLNHGSYGAVPVPVQRAQQRLRGELDANPMAFYTRGLIDRIAHTRRHLATFLGADPAGTALVPNATAGSQVVLNSLDLAPGEEILVTDHGYSAVRIAADRLARRTGATVVEVPVALDAGDDEIVATLARAAKPGRTRLAAIDHITSTTAKLMPVARVTAALRDLGVPVLVDAAHSPGQLPVDVSAVAADYWIGNFHKWAFAPRPTAVLVVAPERREAIRPLVVSWRQDEGFPVAVEFAGALDYTAWLAAPAGVHLMRTLGLDRIRRHNLELVEHGQRVVAEAIGVDREGLPAGPVSMRLVPLPRGVANSPAAANELRVRLAVEHGCEVAIGVWSDRTYLRVSAQVYNRLEDYERLARVLPGALRRTA